MLLYSLVSLLPLVLVTVANPLVVRQPLLTLPLAKRFNITGSNNILKSDRARAAALIERVRERASGKAHKRDVISIGVENQAVTYVADVNVGTPPTTCTFVEIYLKYQWH